MSRATDAIDSAIEECSAYISGHASGTRKQGWGWTTEAARVVAILSDARATVMKAEAAAPVPEEDHDA